MSKDIKKAKVGDSKQVNLDGMPAYKLSFSDKFFLAVAKKNTEKLAFVYSVYCPSEGYMRYSGCADVEVATFDNPDKAEIFYQTISEIIETEKEILPELYKCIVDANKNAVEKFKRKYK